MSINVVKRLIKLLHEQNKIILGIIENLSFHETSIIKSLAAELKVRYLGSIPFDERLESSLGDVNRLLRTNFSMKLYEILKKLF